MPLEVRGKPASKSKVEVKVDLLLLTLGPEDLEFGVFKATENGKDSDSDYWIGLQWRKLLHWMNSALQGPCDNLHILRSIFPSMLIPA